MNTQRNRRLPLWLTTVIISAHSLALPAASHSETSKKIQEREEQKKYKYFMCEPLSLPEPTVPEVTECILRIKTTWESSWLPAVRSKQQYLIARQNTGSILQWAGISGGAAAATLGISSPKSSGTTAIVIGSASVLTAITGIIWKQELSNTRIAKCTDVLSKQYKIQASLETWYLRSNDPEFRRSFLAKINDDFIEVIRPGLEGCMPGDFLYQS